MITFAVKCSQTGTLNTTGFVYPSISNNSILVLKSEFTNRAVPAIGDDLVQMGNATNKARQGLIYLTASEDGKPRISVMDGVNSTSLVGKNKVILGSLDGITDTDFPADFQPSGYGLYAMNVFLKGIFVLRNGKSVEGRDRSGTERSIGRTSKSRYGNASVSRVHGSGWSV